MAKEHATVVFVKLANGQSFGVSIADAAKLKKGGFVKVTRIPYNDTVTVNAAQITAMTEPKYVTLP